MPLLIQAQGYCCCALQGSCPEDTVDAATLASGYKWVPDSLRITEANEPLLSLTCHNAAYWDKHNAHALRQVGAAAAAAAAGAAQVAGGSTANQHHSAWSAFFSSAAQESSTVVQNSSALHGRLGCS